METERERLITEQQGKIEFLSDEIFRDLTYVLEIVADTNKSRDYKRISPDTVDYLRIIHKAAIKLAVYVATGDKEVIGLS